MKSNLFFLFSIFCVVLSLQGCGGSSDSSSSNSDSSENSQNNTGQIPNILLIISDDQGQDASAQYNLTSDKPKTPRIDQLASEGIVFENAWATPACTTTRGAIITGQFGINSGIDTVPYRMSTDTNTLQRAISTDPITKEMNNAIFGKWHLAGANPDPYHPNQSGVSHYFGNIKGNLSDYNIWDTVNNGEEETSMTYHTTAVTDKAIEWIGLQNAPWFAWVAYAAPHAPFHLPPVELHSRDLSGDTDHINNNKRDYYLAAIEAMDYEIGRLIDSLDETTKDNTLIIFLGDNGSPSTVVDTSTYVASQAKNTLFEGGIRVPFVVSGATVNRKGVRESALLNVVDIFPTILQATGASAQDGIDGQSFYSLLSNPQASKREFNYAEFVSTDVTGWAVSNGRYKLIELADGSQQLYDLSTDLREVNNLMSQTNHEYGDIVNTLSAYGKSIRGESSSSSSTEAKDITDVILQASDAYCSQYADSYRSDAFDVNENTHHQGSLIITVEGDECVFKTNLIPNHHFNDGNRAFPNSVQAQDDEYRITTKPSFATNNSPLLLTQDNALLLNGAKVDILAAACYGVGDGKVGCNNINQPWRYDPMHQANGFNTDSHNAHTQPNGAYHYHGTPNALFNENSASVVVGFAADGFPIYSGYISEGGEIRRVTSSYSLKAGDRPNTSDSPKGRYDGTYRDDYEYVEGAGDLDDCNGMTLNGVYGYHITEGFPYVLSCFKGEPNSSFMK